MSFGAPVSYGMPTESKQSMPNATSYTSAAFIKSDANKANGNTEQGNDRIWGQPNSYEEMMAMRGVHAPSIHQRADYVEEKAAEANKATRLDEEAAKTKKGNEDEEKNNKAEAKKEKSKVKEATARTENSKVDGA